MEDFSLLRKAVDNAELVDAHAHSIVALDTVVPFAGCFSEATAVEALSFSTHSISFKRNLREIAELYGCDSSLQSIEDFRRSSGLDAITAMCFKAAGISSVVVEDGFELDKIHDINWLRKFVPSVGRILGIERLAEQILDEGSPIGGAWTLSLFMEAYLQQLKSLAGKVVGLKSIAASRSGLEISTNVTSEEAEKGLIHVLQAGSPVRLTNKNFIDHLFTCTLEVAVSLDLPIQIHTGFGNKDLDLRLSNPLHLRKVLEDSRFSKSRLVLLHASYPFSKEASYLASVYPQVYLDIGLAIPKLSFHGMISSVKELLELASIKKVMFSTDARAFPEDYFLGAQKARKVVFSVMRDACVDGDLSLEEAIAAVTDIFSGNAKAFYKINNDQRPFNSNASACKLTKGLNSPKNDIKFVRILWVDISGQHRCRVIPYKRFHDVVKKNGVGLACACIVFTSSVDGPADGTNLNGVGEVRLMPDLSTKYTIPWAPEQEMVLGDMDLTRGKAWEYCPREVLRRVSKVLKDEFNLIMNAGFEGEFFLLKNVASGEKEEWVPYDNYPYCSTSAIDAAFPVLRELFTALKSLSIPVEQMHAEGGKGQYEIALGYTICDNAADNLVYTHEVVKSIARKHGLLATFIPKYAFDDLGSGSHVHISLSENGENVFMAGGELSDHGMSKIGEEFMAGVLDHLPSILAFTAPIPNSYDRIQPHAWSGAHLCWGKENRGATIRTASPPGVPDGAVSNFEVRAVDGCANPYLALAAIMAAGIDGLRRHLNLPKSVDEHPEDCEEEIKRLPNSLSESLEALEKDLFLKEMIGQKLITAIQGVRKAEIKYYSENKDAYKKLIYRY